MPPTIESAIGRCSSAPGPIASAGGRAPAIVAVEVIRIGRSRIGHACSSASWRSVPCARIWLVKSTSRIEFFLAMPISRISPSML